MGSNQAEYAFENERLRDVEVQIGIQLEAAWNFAGKVKKDLTGMQKSMWEYVKPTPDDLDDIAGIWQVQTDIIREGTKAIFLTNQARKLERMANNPYFARIDFKEAGEENAEEIYIGISNLKDEKTGKFLIYDWRAPVCSMFYDYEPGNAGYTCQAGRIEGELLLKRQFRIWNGELKLMFDSNLAINDEILQEILGRSADNRMKTIVSTIQREQNNIIRNDTHKLLIVTGPAGSGKTSIALHRAAFLLYRHRDSITSKNIVIFSPNEIFSDYISDVLPELGEEDINRSTFFEYAVRTLGPEVSPENASRLMEFLLAADTMDSSLADRGTDGCSVCLPEVSGDRSDRRLRIEGIKYKASFEIIDHLRKHVQQIEKSWVFHDVVFRGEVIEAADEISEYFHEGLKFLPIIKRLGKIRSRLTSKLDILVRKRVEEVVQEVALTGEYIDAAEIRGRSIAIVHGEASEARRLIGEMTALDMLGCYEGFLNDREIYVGKTGSFDRTSGKRRVNYEDAAPMVLLNGLLNGFPNMDGIKYVLIDEVQDYTPAQLEILRELFGNCNLTLLGDPNQALNPYVPALDIERLASSLGYGSYISARLVKSYRSTRQIADLCSGIIGKDTDAESVNREGELPEAHCCADKEELYQKTAADIENLKRQGMKSIAVIMKTEHECTDAFNTLGKYTELSLITGERQEFFTGTVVIPSYLSKGLEFDAVLVICPDSGIYCSEEEKGLLYTVCSRALHALQFYYIKELPVFLKHMPETLYKLCS
ncbi:MAG TPA: UvrD-helicase domain-containing protein [Clostridia bacterium]|nr:UvrD-helicase domain-containing protein [Clostridia bacterium]